MLCNAKKGIQLVLQQFAQHLCTRKTKPRQQPKHTYLDVRHGLAHVQQHTLCNAFIQKINSDDFAEGREKKNIYTKIARTAVLGRTTKPSQTNRILFILDIAGGIVHQL